MPAARVLGGAIARIHRQHEPGLVPRSWKTWRMRLAVCNRCGQAFARDRLPQLARPEFLRPYDTDWRPLPHSASCLTRRQRKTVAREIVRKDRARPRADRCGGGPALTVKRTGHREGSTQSLAFIVPRESGSVDGIVLRSHVAPLTQRLSLPSDPGVAQHTTVNGRILRKLDSHRQDCCGSKMNFRTSFTNTQAVRVARLISGTAVRSRRSEIRRRLRQRLPGCRFAVCHPAP